MIEPILKDAALLADIRAANHDGGHFRLWWLGQSGFLLQWRGHHLLLDPYLSESLTRKYAKTDKPHVRMTACPVNPACLDFINVVTSSHNHTDHLDPDTLVPILRANNGIALVVAAANRESVAARLDIARSVPLGLETGERVEIGPFCLAGC